MPFALRTRHSALSVLLFSVQELQLAGRLAFSCTPFSYPALCCIVRPLERSVREIVFRYNRKMLPFLLDGVQLRQHPLRRRWV